MPDAATETDVAGDRLLQVRAPVSRDGEQDFSWESLHLEQPRPDEVLLKMTAVGVCHTDIAALRAQLPVTKPVVLGHEGVGVVLRAGGEVTGLEPGQRVVIGFAFCGRCRSCSAGRPSSCLRFRELNFGGVRLDGSTPLTDRQGSPVRGQFFGQSAFGTHCVVAARQVVPIPDDIPDDVAAPLGCAALTGAGTVLNALRVEVGSSIIVTGAGSVGLVAIAAARARGAETVVAVDRVPARLSLAGRLGATHTVDLSQTTIDESEVGQQLFEFGVDTTGRQEVVADLGARVGAGGKLALVSFSGGATSIDYDHVRGRTLVGVVAGNSVPAELIPQLVDLWRAGSLPLDVLTTVFPIDAVADAMAAMESGAVVKPVLVHQ